MSPCPEVLHRLLLSKSLLAARTASQGGPSPHLVARQVLSAHDAADLTFAAIADHQRKLTTGKSPSMLQCLELIDSKKKHAAYFKQLNDARNSLKHVGNLPNNNQWATVSQDVFDKLARLCEETLGVSLEDLDESVLLVNEEARTHLDAAKLAKQSQNFKLALEELGTALYISLEAPPVGDAVVGRPNAEDALKLTAYGVSANISCAFKSSCRWSLGGR